MYVHQGERLQKKKRREDGGVGGVGVVGGGIRSTKGGVCKNAKPWFTSAGS